MRIQEPRIKSKLKDLPKSTANELVTSEERLKQAEWDHISSLQPPCLEQH